MTKRIAIIGTGFTGLAAAYDLTRAGYSVMLFDAAPRPGGAASWFTLGTARLEYFYHHLFTSDHYILQLAAQLGCTEAITSRKTISGIHDGKQLYPFSSPLDLLRFTPLPIVSRLRLALAMATLRYLPDVSDLDQMTAVDWVCGRMGEPVLDTIWGPLLQGKFGAYAGDISAAWLKSKLTLRGGSRNHKGQERLLYIRGGFATLITALCCAIEQQGGVIHCNSKVLSLVVEQSRVKGLYSQHGAVDCDQIIATCSLDQTAQLMAPHVPESYLNKLNGIDSLASVCLLLVLKQSLSDVYWISVTDPQSPFVAVVEHTLIEPPSSYGGRHIVYLSTYLARADRRYGQADDALLRPALVYLEKMFPSFHPDQVLESYVWRAPATQPVVSCGYRQRIPEYHTPVDGFWIANMAQIHPEDRGTNFAVREGRKLATLIQAQ